MIPLTAEQVVDRWRDVEQDLKRALKQPDLFPDERAYLESVSSQISAQGRAFEALIVTTPQPDLREWEARKRKYDAWFAIRSKTLEAVDRVARTAAALIDFEPTPAWEPLEIPTFSEHAQLEAMQTLHRRFMLLDQQPAFREDEYCQTVVPRAILAMRDHRNGPGPRPGGPAQRAIRKSITLEEQALAGEFTALINHAAELLEFMTP
ncbi:MAG TPA: hypothetical protein VKZ49_19040 [Polyangiaceae bacterium]|nr:hypothetical protein [Polyangiaceae bacterium]